MLPYATRCCTFHTPSIVTNRPAGAYHLLNRSSVHCGRSMHVGLEHSATLHVICLPRLKCHAMYGPIYRLAICPSVRLPVCLRSSPPARQFAFVPVCQPLMNVLLFVHCIFCLVFTTMSSSAHRHIIIRNYHFVMITVFTKSPSHRKVSEKF